MQVISEEAGDEGPLPLPHAGGVTAEACAERTKFIARIIRRYSGEPARLAAEAEANAYEVVVQPRPIRNGESQTPDYDCHRAVGAFDLSLKVFTLLRLREIWTATDADLVDRKTWEPLATEFRWWFQLAALLYPAAANADVLKENILPPSVSLPEYSQDTTGVEDRKKLHNILNDLAALREPQIDMLAGSGEVFPPAWYWHFCLKNNCTEFQTVLVEFATYNRIKNPPDAKARLRRHALVSRRWIFSRWLLRSRIPLALRWIVYGIHLPFSNIRFALSCLSPTRDRRFENANIRDANAEPPHFRWGFIPQTARGWWWLTWLLILLIAMVGVGVVTINLMSR